VALEKSKIWTHHNDETCQACTVYNSQCKGGAPTKKRHGSIKLKFDICNKDIFSSLFPAEMPVNNIPPSCHIQNISAKQENNFTCYICNKTLSFTSVSTGCHLFCSECLSNVFTKSKQNDILCPKCSSVVNFEQVNATDTAFRSILSDMIVKCNNCGLSHEYHAMVGHKCTPITSCHGKKSNASDIQTPKHTKSKIVNVSLNRSLTSPLTKEEERVHTQLIKRKLKTAGDVIKCRTGGQALYLMKIRHARKTSVEARTPIVRRLCIHYFQYKANRHH